MDGAFRTYEIQQRMKRNAEEFKNTMNDLYNWEKEIKDQEKHIQSQTDEVFKEKSSLPIRSHIEEQAYSKPSPNSHAVAVEESPVSSPTEKCDTPLDPLELKRKEANEIKDRGNKHVKMAEYQLAIDDYTQAIQLYSTDPVFYSNRAFCYLKLERYNDCIEDCERAIEIDSLAVKAYYRRMLANESLGNNMDALKDCTSVLMIEPNNSEANRSLERINERLRKNVKSPNGPNFCTLSANMLDILPIEKPAYKRSTKPLKRIAIADVVGPKDSKNYENLKISDEDIDKLFNSNCGNFEEIKNVSSTPSPSTSKESSLKATIEHKPNTSIMEIRKEPEDNKKSLELSNTKIAKETIAKKTEKSMLASTKDSNKEDVKEVLNNDIKELKRPLPPVPTSTAQFYCNWKELNSLEKYEYLKSIQLTQLCKILGAGFDSDTLSDIILTLHDFYLPQKNASTATTLLEVSKNKQVSILSLLMSNEERKALSEIINSLKENNSLNDAAAEQIMKNFNLN